MFANSKLAMNKKNTFIGIKATSQQLFLKNRKS